MEIPSTIIIIILLWKEKARGEKRGTICLPLSYHSPLELSALLLYPLADFQALELTVVQII